MLYSVLRSRLLQKRGVCLCRDIIVPESLKDILYNSGSSEEFCVKTEFKNGKCQILLLIFHGHRARFF
jgi:hypothetical protein